MDSLRIRAEARGFFSRTDALAAGYDDNAIRRALKTRVWTRVRQGAYTFTDVWQASDANARHLAAARAVATRLFPRVALSHTSAALEHGMLVWNTDLARAHVTRLDGHAGHIEAGVVHHEGTCTEDDVDERDGYLVMNRTRAALEASSLMGSESAVVLLDDCLHRTLFDEQELDEVYRSLGHWPNTLHLQFAVRFADGRAESAGESRSRYLCCVHGLPAPTLQFHVYDEFGGLIGITDLAWEHERLLGEFDGKVKYGRLLKPGEEPGDAVFREKVREDALRRVTGYSMIRLIWADLYQGARTAARIRRLMQPAAA